MRGTLVPDMMVEVILVAEMEAELVHVAMMVMPVIEVMVVMIVPVIEVMVMMLVLLEFLKVMEPVEEPVKYERAAE